MKGILPELADWDSFYVIVGSAAGALIGLQFVVVTLIAERPPERVKEAGATFATPTIVHFGAVLLLSALLQAPWWSITAVAVLWGLLGFGGLAYAVIVARRMRRQAAYEPVAEDWLFHVALPLAAYGTLMAAAFVNPLYEGQVLFGVGAAALVLLFIGIHNAWDTVLHLVYVRAQDRHPGPSAHEREPPDRPRGW